MSDRYQLDVNNLEYIPPPPKPPWFDEELERLMPRNDFGESFLRMEWGMNATTFRNGNPKAPLKVAAHEKNVTLKFRRFDPVEGKFEYFDTRKEAVDAINIRLLPQIDYRRIREVRLWGPPRWMALAWVSPARLGPPETWEKNRYAEVKTPGGTVKLDCNGPFPSRGQYRHFWTVEGAGGEFRDLDRGVMTEIERLVSDHKKAVAGENAYTSMQELRDEFARAMAEAEAEELRIEDEYMDFVGPGGQVRLVGGVFSGSGGTAAQASRRR